MSARYRAVAYGSTVDEALFGTPRSKSSSRGRSVSGPISTSGAAVIGFDDLCRIKNSSIIRTEAEHAEDKRKIEMMKEERNKASKDRKLKMQMLEKKSSGMARKSDAEIEKEAKQEAQRKSASEQLDNNSDVVKLMTSMAQRAIAFTIREKQIAEKERLEENEKAIDRKMDILNEIDRLKDIQRQEEEAESKKNKRKNDRKYINQQIAERERARMIELEVREQENHIMRETMAKYKDQDNEVAREKLLMVEKSKKAVLVANADAIRRKQEARDQEKKDMQDIIMYNLEMDRKAAAHEAKEEAANVVKKERQMKLVAQQEKALDNAGKLDELRARRAAEEKDRQMREAERVGALKRRSEMKDLLDSRAKQAEDKVQRQRNDKKLNEEEVANNLRYMKRMEDREQKETNEKLRKTNDYKDSLMSQISEIEKRRKFQRGNQGNDAEPNVRQELIREQGKLSVIRDRMVQDLQSQGVEDKYLTELKHVNIAKMLQR